MNSRLLVVAAVLASLLASCSSGPVRAPHPTVAMLDLKQPKYGWFGISFRSKSHRPQLIVRALDGKPVRDQRIPGGLVLTPGPHLVTLSARYQSKADIASRFGEAAEKLGQKLDSMPSKHDRPVPVNAVAGEDYVAHMKPKGDSFRYWIEED